MKKTSMATLETRVEMLSRVLNRIADAARLAERSGETVAVTIALPPNAAEPAITSEQIKRDELDEALSKARQRGAQYVAEIMKKPDMLSGRSFATLIGASPETVNQKRKVGELLGVEGATRGVRFPRWQITDDGRPLPGLKSLFDILGGDPWTVYRFLNQRHNELGGMTGIQAMKAGRINEVQDVARNLRGGVFA